MAMFGSQDKEGPVSEVTTAQPSEDTIIGKTIKIEGDLISNGDIIVEGEVTGTLKTEKTLRVGQGAKVSADVKANIALISGEVTGNLDVTDKVELTESAVVNGDIKAKVVSIHAGASFNGRCTMEGTGVNITAQAPMAKAEEKKPDQDDDEDDD
jgi:cytoskeletal protein CcmA (bactofilin family)